MIIISKKYFNPKIKNMKKRKKINKRTAPCETSNVVLPTTVQQYETCFFRKAKSTTRNGKIVYIRKEFHERIMKIVQVIGENDYTLFDYLDNILELHFDTYKDEITELYRKKNTDIF
ncbi:DUF3408 domain-containing protein [Dysgonomonas sp.]|uniref:DUF3408 domain-containing protein n=1 Tax=unclassified Dysgonomonas TaxID=2630389 RepID=UPI002D1FAC9D|nr:DUF3408 domain-containing protein [Dysgonomonas sp.]